MTATDFLVRTRALTGFVPLVSQLGGDARALLARHGVTPEQIESEDFTLPLRAYASLMHEAASSLKRDDFGILLAERQNLSILGPIALAAQHSGTVREALERISRYMPYHSPGLVMTVATQGEQATLRLQHNLPVQGEALRHLTELPYAVAIAFLRMITGDDGQHWQLSFEHDSPLTPQNYRMLLGCDVKLLQPQDGLLFPAALLARPIDAANPELQQTAERTVRYLMQRTPLDLGQQVSSLIERTLATGDCTLPVIAEQMKMPRHQLQRRLAALDLRFEELLDNIRRERLLNLLLHSRIAVTDIAQLLGYSDATSLTRACRRWYGQSPRALRNSKVED
ncbi:AraC family transcriptional regulator [Thalassolituus marinus]|uniref:AraC family transcriptional regulator ligand-binding domain-containing protein n=1 Tax=Thalassolituus marinus TaxID=671053 RepID=A0ABS7ZUJ2_9GAMM|nr:AraC family transcriptional regulator [Thalassolituus marinus]MCA6064070.1 AraC family transcriptional regulator ligand-binding domain-containing protein [Thalassolituus marinus]